MLRTTALLLSVSVLGVQAVSERALRDRIQAYLDEWRAAASFPGAGVGVVLKDGTAFAVTTGVSDRAAGAPVTADDLFMAGSTGKTFFAAVAVQLTEGGQLALDAPVSKYLGDRPWFARLPNAKDITLWHFPDAGVTLAIQINSSAQRATGPRGLVRGLYDIAAMVTRE